MSLGFSSGDQSKDLGCLGTLGSWGDRDSGAQESWAGLQPWDTDFTFDAFASGKSLNGVLFPLCKMGRIITSYLVEATGGLIN